MDYIKIRFDDEICTKEKASTRRFEEMFHSLNPMFSMDRSVWKPQVDIWESGEEVLISAALAGVDEKNMAVEISSRAVKISGNRKAREAGSEHTFLQAEIRYGRFERILYLPCSVSIDSVKASFANGLLTLHLVKSTTGDL